MTTLNQLHDNYSRRRSYIFLTFDAGLELAAARSFILAARVMRGFAFVSCFVGTLCTHKQQELFKHYTMV
jgi:hypothetical protein